MASNFVCKVKNEQNLGVMLKKSELASLHKMIELILQGINHLEEGSKDDSKKVVTSAPVEDPHRHLFSAITCLKRANQLLQQVVETEKIKNALVFLKNVATLKLALTYSFIGSTLALERKTAEGFSADTAYKMACSLYEELGLKSNAAVTYYQLGYYYAKQGSVELADEELMKAGECFKSGDATMYAKVLMTRAELISFATTWKKMKSILDVFLNGMQQLPNDNRCDDVLFVLQSVLKNMCMFCAKDTEAGRFSNKLKELYRMALRSKKLENLDDICELWRRRQ